MRLQHNPEWKWLWVDEDGDIYVYEMKPQLDKFGYYKLKNGLMPSKLSRDEFDCSLICKHTNSLYQILEDGTLLKYVERSELKVDDPVLVRDHELQEWSPKYFAGWDHDGRIQTFYGGATSWSNNDFYLFSWNEWKLPEDNKK